MPLVTLLYYQGTVHFIPYEEKAFDQVNEDLFSRGDIRIALLNCYCQGTLETALKLLQDLGTAVRVWKAGIDLNKWRVELLDNNLTDFECST